MTTNATLAIVFGGILAALIFGVVLAYATNLDECRKDRAALTDYKAESVLSIEEIKRLRKLLER